MHAYPNVNAVAPPPAQHGRSISAVMQTREYASISRLMASVGLDEKLRSDGKIKVAEVDRALAPRGLSIQQRIAIKSTLTGLGLLAS